MTPHIDSQNNVRFLPFAKTGVADSAGDIDAQEKRVPAVEVGNTLAKLVDALTHLPVWKGVLAWNEFTHRIVFRREAPFGDVVRLGDHLRDDDIIRMRLWFEVECGELVSSQNVIDASRVVAFRNRFNPLQEHLSSLEWDGISRIETWLEDYCAVRPSSVEHQRLVRAVAKKWLVSCVARAMTPGCKVDTMLILEGQQGIGKSTALAALAGEGFFCDGLIDFGTKDACQNIQGVWIYELSELDALLRGDSSSTKAFLSRATDKFRAPYTRSPQIVPRSVVFCGTVNHGGYLKDQTGNRRYWIVRCEDTLDVEGIRAVRDQLWAEARMLFEKGEPWHLSPDEEALMREEQRDRVEIEPWEDQVADWVMKQGDAPIAIDHLLEAALGLRAASRNPNVTIRVNHIMERLGFRRERKDFERTGRRVYRYVRRDAPRASRPADPLPYCGVIEAEADATHHDE